MQKARRHCRMLRIAAGYCDSRYFEGTAFKQLEITLPGGVRIIGLPANAATVRGFTGDVFLDEFAMHRDDRDIWAAVFPTLLRDDGELDVASTPKGKGNLFYRLSHNERFERTIVTLPEAIGQGLQVDADEIRRSMGDEQLYRQEFLCEFLDETTALLTYDQISACQDATLVKDAPVEDLSARGDLYVGVDIGRKRDLTVIWVLERDGETLVTRAVYERRGLPFRRQYELVGRVLALPDVHRCCIDAGGLGMPLAEAAVEDFGGHRVESVTFTNAVKSELAGRLRIAVEERRIRIPVDDAIRDDWHGVERCVSAGGHLRLDASRSGGGHADRFWAAALAVHAVGVRLGPRRCLNVRPLAFACRGAW